MAEEPNEKILRQVRHMLDKANHPNTPDAEREMCIRRADTLMLRYAIDQALLDATKKDDRRLPVTRKFHAYDGREWKYKFGTILHAMEETYRCRVAIHHNGDVTVVGMPEDVDYMELIWTNVYLTFISRLYPRWDDNLSFDHNVYNYKRAGFKWAQIYKVATEHHHYLRDEKDGAMIRGYKRHAEMVGDTSTIKTQKHEAFRESFAEGFVRSLCARLETVRSETSEAATGSGAELALVDVRDRVQEAFYETFPDFRPMSEEERARLLQDIREREEREARALQERLDAMTPAERRRYEDEQERERRRQAKADERYWRNLAKDSARRYDPDGMSTGRAAGQEVNLGHEQAVGATKAGELE
jgi:hypothetical protein